MESAHFLEEGELEVCGDLGGVAFEVLVIGVVDELGLLGVDF